MAGILESMTESDAHEAEEAEGVALMKAFRKAMKKGDDAMAFEAFEELVECCGEGGPSLAIMMGKGKR